LINVPGPIFFISQTQEFVAICYSLEAYPPFEKGIDFIGGISTIFIFNKDGELTQKIEDKKYASNIMAMSSSGSYLALQHGLGYVEDAAPSDIGFQFFDIHDGELIFSYQDNNETGEFPDSWSYTQVLPSQDADLFFFTKRLKELTIFIVDLKNKRIGFRKTDYENLKNEEENFFNKFFKPGEKNKKITEDWFDYVIPIKF
jgi:hypothetical protein